MKKYSEEVISVLRDATFNPEFAKIMLNDLDRVQRLYELKPEEVEFISKFRNQEEVKQDFYRLRGTLNPLEYFINKYSNLMGIPALLAGIFVLGTLLYILGSLFFPTTFTSLGLLTWTEVDSTVRQVLIMYGFLLSGVIFFWLSRKISGLKTPTRIILLIIFVVLIFIPTSILINTLPLPAQVTLARVLLILVFTVLPASMYSLFITTKRKALWEEFARNLARIDPVRYRNLIPIYRKKYEALYGPPNQSKDNPTLLRVEASFPVLLATFIIGLGWILFFSVQASEFDLFVGRVTPFTFGFLGAYLFSLQMLFRRYVQSDLKPTAYTHVSQRILMTWVWALVLSVIPWQSMGIDSTIETEIVSILAFTVGIFPDIAWQVISLLIQRLLAFPLPSFRQGHPLNQIDGITIWVEARLLEENIENVQNLITTGVFDLMLRTNIEPLRIINWIDQGVLKLHLEENKGEGKQEKTTLSYHLSERGILTATDLLDNYNVFKRSRKRSTSAKFFITKELDPVVKNLVASIDNDPNMYHVKAWRDMNLQFSQKFPGAIEEYIVAEANDGIQAIADILSDAGYEPIEP